jgi:superfamily II DNA or RNA helicase
VKRIDAVIAETLVEPRPYQRRIVGNAIDMYFGQYKNKAGETEHAVNSVMIESPTGSGKTVMALVMAKVMQTEFPDLVVGWVAMRRNLLRQVEAENVAKKINVANFHPTSMFDHRPEELVKARQDGRKILLIIDEAQHDAASSCTHLHNITKPDFVLGMTATPFRTDSMKLCFSKVIKDAGIHQLIQDGYLSKYHHFTIPDWRPETVAEFYAADPQRWGKSIFYFLTTEECYETQRQLSARGIVSDVVTGASNNSYREDQLEAFRTGQMPCLINCMVLTEGFDDPSLATAWVRDSGRGPTMQMAGRAFRKYPDVPYKMVVQSKMTRWPMIKTAMPEEQYLWQEDGWRTLKVNPQLDQINNNARMAIATTYVNFPKWLADKAVKTSRRRRRRGF